MKTSHKKKLCWNEDVPTRGGVICGVRSWPKVSLGVSCGMVLPVPMSHFGEDRVARSGHKTWEKFIETLY